MIMKKLDHNLDMIGVKDPQNVNLLPFQDNMRNEQRRKYAKELVNDNQYLEMRK